MTRKSYIQINGKLIPKEEYHGNNSRGELPHVLGDIEPFKSPITGEVIKGRGHLRRHMKEHGVTHSADYSPEYLAKVRNDRIRQQQREGKAHRIELLKQQLER